MYQRKPWEFSHFQDFSGSDGTGPTVKRDHICHMQTIEYKAPHTKLHALLPD